MDACIVSAAAIPGAIAAIGTSPIASAVSIAMRIVSSMISMTYDDDHERFRDDAHEYERDDRAWHDRYDHDGPWDRDGHDHDGHGNHDGHHDHDGHDWHDGNPNLDADRHEEHVEQRKAKKSTRSIPPAKKTATRKSTTTYGDPPPGPVIKGVASRA